MKKTSKMPNLKKSKKERNKLRTVLGYFSTTLHYILLFSCSTIIDSSRDKIFSQEPGPSGAKFNSLVQVNSSSNKDTLKIRSPMGAAMRSILVPGLGQLYNGKKLKAVLVVTSEGILIYSIINENKKFNDTKDAIYRNRRNTFEWWLLFVLGVSAIDAYVDAYLHRFDENMNISFNGLQRFCLNLSIRF